MADMGGADVGRQGEARTRVLADLCRESGTHLPSQFWGSPAASSSSLACIVGTQEQLEIVQERLQQEAIIRSSTGVGERAFTPDILLVDTPEKEAQTRQLIESVRMDGDVGNFILEVIDLRDR